MTALRKLLAAAGATATAAALAILPAAAFTYPDAATARLDTPIVDQSGGTVSGQYAGFPAEIDTNGHTNAGGSLFHTTLFCVNYGPENERGGGLACTNDGRTDGDLRIQDDGSKALWNTIDNINVVNGATTSLTRAQVRNSILYVLNHAPGSSINDLIITQNAIWCLNDATINGNHNWWNEEVATETAPTIAPALALCREAYGHRDDAAPSLSITGGGTTTTGTTTFGIAAPAGSTVDLTVSDAGGALPVLCPATQGTASMTGNRLSMGDQLAVDVCLTRTLNPGDPDLPVTLSATSDQGKDVEFWIMKDATRRAADGTTPGDELGECQGFVDIATIPLSAKGTTTFKVPPASTSTTTSTTSTTSTTLPTSSTTTSTTSTTLPTSSSTTSTTSTTLPTSSSTTSTTSTTLPSSSSTTSTTLPTTATTPSTQPTPRTPVAPSTAPPAEVKGESIDRQLPRTGAETAELVALAGVLATAGGCLVVFARQRS